MAKLSFSELFNRLREISAPTVWIETPDNEATKEQIAKRIASIDARIWEENAKHDPDLAGKEHVPYPILMWDVVRGLNAVNAQAVQLVQDVIGFKKDPQSGKDVLDKASADRLRSPSEMLNKAREKRLIGDQAVPLLPEGTVLFMSNLHLFIKEPPVIQAVQNLRDAFKVDGRMLIPLSPSVSLPPELADVVVLNEPLPDKEELSRIITITYEAVGQEPPKPESELMEKATSALAGLPAFRAETASSIAIGPGGIKIEQLWDSKRQMVKQQGLVVYQGPETFPRIGGNANFKNFLTKLQHGKRRLGGLILLDEMDKQFGGAANRGDTTYEMQGMLLSYLQDRRARGILIFGQSGAGKTATIKAFANEAEVPLILMNVGTAKGRYVGDSNANFTAQLNVIDAVTQGDSFWFGTANDLSGISPELLARFAFGTFFADLPNRGERATIWDIYLNQYGLIEDKNNPRPDDSGWTGREIESCVMKANDLNIPLREAALTVTPPRKDRISEMRQEAEREGYISVSTPGPYKAAPAERGDVSGPSLAAAGGTRKIFMPGKKNKSFN